MGIKRKKFIIVIVILLVLFVILGGYLIYKSSSRGNEANRLDVPSGPTNSNDTDISDKNEKPDDVMDEEEEIIEDVAILEEMKSLVSFDIQLTDELISGETSQFEDWQKILITMYHYRDELVKDTDGTYFHGKVKKEELREKAAEIFGEDVSYSDGNHGEFQKHPLVSETIGEYIADHNIVTYDGSYYTVSAYFPGHGGGFDEYLDVPYRMVKKGNTYQLQCYRIFYPTFEIGINTFHQYYKEKSMKTVVFDLAGTKYEYDASDIMDIDDLKAYSIPKSELSQEIRNLKNNDLSIVTYTFVEEDGRKIWTEYSIQN